MRLSSFTNSYSIVKTRNRSGFQKTAKNICTSNKLNARLQTIKSCINTKPLNKCPECGGKILYSAEDEDEAYCTRCGLITSSSYQYVAGRKINLPYGLRLKR